MEFLISVITGVISIASIIAAITPSPKDNEWLEKAIKFINLLAVNIGHAKK